MAPASSSALRDDGAADGPVYGSLTGIGGPRTFKKKPVLVLDQDELEAAYAMFHEASAEMLGEEVERAPRPATILGLAPMLDDNPEEMGESDEEGADVDDGLVDAEAVLSLTQRKSAAIPIDEYFGDGMGEEDFYGASAYDAGTEADAAVPGEIEDGLDLSKRIFPSLPIQLEPEPQFPPDARLLDYQDVAPGADDGGEKSFAAEPEPEAQAAPPVEPAPAAPAPTGGPRPARFDELNPNRPQDEEEVFDLDAWLAEEQDEPIITQRPVTYTPRREPEPELEPEPEPEPEPHSAENEAEVEPAGEDVAPSYTVIEDDDVDGCAFMRPETARKPPVNVERQGAQNSLRARLIKEAEAEEAAKAAALRDDSGPAPASATVRFWSWLRGLFS